MSARTFKVTAPPMTGTDVLQWQGELRERFAAWHIDYPVVTDGVYGVATRSATASFMRAWGVDDTGEALEDGLTSWWRSKLRADHRSAHEALLFASDERKAYRAALRKRYEHIDVAAPVSKIIEDGWGWRPPIHDGIDLICPPEAPVLAIVSGEIIRADASGWWGKGAQSSAGHPVSDGDGIIVLRGAVNVGPFRKGMNFCYGHAEGAVVREGQNVKAGQRLGHAGFANAWHVHFMVNDNANDRGVGDRDPRPFVDYAVAHG